MRYTTFCAGAAIRRWLGRRGDHGGRGDPLGVPLGGSVPLEAIRAVDASEAEAYTRVVNKVISHDHHRAL